MYSYFTFYVLSPGFSPSEYFPFFFRCDLFYEGESYEKNSKHSSIVL